MSNNSLLNRFTLAATLLIIAVVMSIGVHLKADPVTFQSQPEILELLKKERGTPGPIQFVPRQVIVRLNSSAFGMDLQGKEMVTSVSSALSSAPVYLLEIPEDLDEELTSEYLASLPGIAYAHPNYVLNQLHPIQGSYPFSDQQLVGDIAGQYATNMLQLSSAHQLATGVDVTIAVIDGGVDVTHPTLEGSAIYGFDFVGNDVESFDELDGTTSGHGTFVAELTHLTAPDANIVAYRVMDKYGNGDGFTLAKAIERAVADGSDVINLSLALMDRHLAVRDAIDAAVSAGVVVVAGAGNEGKEGVIYPAGEFNVIAVASVDSSFTASDFTSRGDFVNISAPGAMIYSAYQNHGYAWWSGTSFSTPFVSGVAALLKEVNPSASWLQIRSLLTSAAVDIDSYNPSLAGKLGNGFLDPLAAINGSTSSETATVIPDSIHFVHFEGTVNITAPFDFVLLTSSNAPAAYTGEVVNPNNPLFVFLEEPSGLTYDSVKITINPYDLTPGNYYNSVLFQVEGVPLPAELIVSLTVYPQQEEPVDSSATIAPNYFYFTAEAYTEALLFGVSALTSTNQPAAYTATLGPNGDHFVDIMTASGSTPDSVRISISPSLLPGPGLYFDTVVCQVEGISDPAKLAVYLELTDPDTSGGQTDFIPPQVMPVDSTDCMVSKIALDPSQVLDGSGIRQFYLDSSSYNVSLWVQSFTPGDLSVPFTISLINPDASGFASLFIYDVAGNFTNYPVLLNPCPPDTGGGQTDFTPPIVSINSSDECFIDATALDQGTNASGINHIFLDTSHFNLALTVTPFTPGELSVDFQVALTDSTQIGLGGVLIIDVAGNRNWYSVALQPCSPDTGGPQDDVIPPTVNIIDSTGICFLNGTAYEAEQNASGISQIFLDTSSFNLALTVIPFTPGQLSANFNITLVDPGQIGSGAVYVFDVAGNFTYKPVQLSCAPDSSSSTNPNNKVVLLQNYPNPFNPTTTIRFSLGKSSAVKLDVFNVLGRHIASLVDKTMEAGEHEIFWDSRAQNGTTVSSGIYFYRLTTGELTLSRKMLLLK